jgi:hypothetical protein
MKNSENLKTILRNENLKKTLIGKDNYLFLINDSSCEIRQHFDGSYKSIFKSKDFKKNFNYKKKFCESRGIEYHFFIIPDKSLVCKDLLPFKTKKIKRNYDSIKDLVPDYIDNLNPICYFKGDTHINYLGGQELTYCYLNHIDENFKRTDLDKLINDQIIIVDFLKDGDLTNEINWSYSPDEKLDYLQEETVSFMNKSIKNIDDKLPDEFKTHGDRVSEYWMNKNSFSDKRVLILRDSSMFLLRNIISTYFKETLLYWDHWAFNEKLVEWYKPDIILEIRTERFLEHMIRFIKI